MHVWDSIENYSEFLLLWKFLEWLGESGIRVRNGQCEPWKESQQNNCLSLVPAVCESD